MEVYNLNKNTQNMNINNHKRDLGADYEHVNHPAHYQGNIEAIDYIEDKLTREEFIGFLKGTALRYLSRLGKKENDLDDTKKAIWYLEVLKKKYGVPVTTPPLQHEATECRDRLKKPTGYSLSVDDMKNGTITVYWDDGTKTKGGYADYLRFWEGDC